MSKFISGVLDFIKDILNSFFETINRILNYIFYVLTTYPVELIIGIILVYLFILLVHDVIVRIRVKRFSEDTEIALRQKLGYIILIFGKIRVGKTTLMSALTHVIVRILRYNAMSRCEQVKGIILNLDWGEIDLIIDKFYQEKKPVKEASEAIYEMYNSQLEKVHKSYINREIKYEDLMNDYVEARYALIRNNYVYALKGQEIYNRITENYSLVYDPKWTQWKDAWQDRDYRFPRYCVILWDEKNMDSEKKALGYFETFKNDDGTPEFLRAFGNAGKEERYMILTAQEAKNWVTFERRLVSSICEVRERRKINVNLLLRKIVNFAINIVNTIYRIVVFLKFTKIRKDNYINNSNIFRKMLKKLNSAIDYLDYKCYLRFDVSLYDNMDDLGKRNTSTRKYSDDLSLYFKTYYAWGNIDTWQLSYMDDELIKRSEHSIFEVDEGQRYLSPEEKFESTKNYLSKEKKEEIAIRKKMKLPNDEMPSAL